MSEMQQNQQERTQQKRREGEVTIDFKPEDKKKSPNKAGDYVDFEEVK